MEAGSAQTRRHVLVVGIALAMVCALGVIADPAEAASRPAPRALRATAHQASLTVRWHAVRKAPGYRVRWSTRHSRATCWWC